MCFNSTVSLTTAVIELGLSIIMPWKFPKASLKYFFALLLFLLGFYQFTEFMLCKTGNAELWVRAGFITYSFLPAMGLDMTLTYFKIKRHRLLLYFFPVVYSLIAIFTTNFVQVGQCNAIFVTARYIFSQDYNFVLWLAYVTYYALVTIFACFIALKYYFSEKNNKKRKVFLMLPVAVLLMSLPTFILMVIFPYFNIMFPSVLCHFALLLAIVVFIGAYWEHKLNNTNL